jgi:hypothetical protein
MARRLDIRFYENLIIVQTSHGGLFDDDNSHFCLVLAGLVDRQKMKEANE